MGREFVPDVRNGEVNSLPVPYEELTADGAVSLVGGVVTLDKAGVLAATIADPPAAMDGAELTVISLTAQAHTLDNSAGSGFNGVGAGGDVGTFGGAIADGIVLIAKGGVWYEKPGGNHNVTLA